MKTNYEECMGIQKSTPRLLEESISSDESCDETDDSESDSEKSETDR